MYQRSNRVCGFPFVTGWSGWVLIGLSMTAEHELEVGPNKDVRSHKMWGTYNAFKSCQNMISGNLELTIVLHKDVRSHKKRRPPN